MTSPVPSHPPTYHAFGISAELVTEALRPQAALRLVAQRGQDVALAARRLLESARAGRIDLSLLMAHVGPGDQGPRTVRQVALGVPGSGRTAAVFLSEPPVAGDPGGPEAGTIERAACADALAQHLAATHPGLVRLLQSLPEPQDLWNINALRMAGFVNVGHLVYLRRSLGRSYAPRGYEPALPGGISLRPLSAIPGTLDEHRPMLVGMLEETYIETLDCPALCGLRETEDILDSHLAVGRFDPSMWFVVMDGTRAAGCVLLSEVPEQRAYELVYFGLAPRVRGRGLGGRLLDIASRRVAARGGEALLCAVDRDNAPAVHLYERAGFKPFGERAALVRAVPVGV